MIHDEVYFGVVQNLLAFPGWRGETDEGVELSRRLLADPFFGVAEIGWIKNPDHRKEVRRLVRESGKEVTYGCGPVVFGEGLDLNNRDEKKRRMSIDRLKQLADDALDYDAKILLLCSGADVAPGLRGEAFRLLTDSIGELCAFCREIRPSKPLVVVVELFDYAIDKKLLLGPTQDAVAVASNIVKDHVNFGLSLDLSHLPLMGEKPADAIARCRPFLKHIHVGNCVLRDKSHKLHGDKHPPFGIEGGEIGREQVQSFLKDLGAGGYGAAYVPTRRPVVIAEVIPQRGDDPAALIENIKDALKK